MTGAVIAPSRDPWGLAGRSGAAGLEPARRKRFLDTDRRSVAIALAFAAVLFGLAWYRYASFRTPTLDLSVFDQAIWKMAHFRAPEVTTIGWNAFADHLSPVLVLFVPLYWVAATPLWLLAAQALALGAGYLALRPVLDATGLDRRYHHPFLVAYLASPLVWNAAGYDFHPTTLAAPFLLVAIRSALVDDWRGLLMSSLALIVLRDDLGLAIAAIALFGTARLPRERRRARYALAAGGIAWMALGGALASALGSDRHWTWHYGYVAASPAAALRQPLETAARVLQGVWRGDNILLLASFLAPLGLLPLLSPRRLALGMVLALPLLASAGPQFHSPQFHYGILFIPLLLPAAASGFTRIPERIRPHVGLWVVTATLLGFYLVGPLQTAAYTRPALDPADARQALSLVQPEDTVVAADSLGVYLAHRDRLLMYPYPFAEGRPTFPLTARATEVSARAAAEVDVILTTAPRSPKAERLWREFLSSASLDQFRVVGRFGEITVFRRVGPGSP